MKELVSRGNKRVLHDGDRIIKVFNDNKPVSDVFNEALNLARVQEAGVRTPDPLSVAKQEGAWALTTSYVPGTTMEEALAKNPEHFDRYLNMFVDFQVDIHTHSAPLLPSQVAKYSRMIASLGDVLDATARYDLEMRLDGMPIKAKICHGDFNFSNVIMAEDGNLYACDWAHATQGAGAADAAMSYLEFAMDDADVADAYLSLYCTKTDTPKQVIRDWLPIVAAAELARKRESDQEFLLSWIDVFDYM